MMQRRQRKAATSKESRPDRCDLAKGLRRQNGIEVDEGPDLVGR